jgi:YggT family protein
LYQLVALLLKLFLGAMILSALVSWVPSLRGPWTSYVDRVVQPVVDPVRRFIPPVGGLDISFMLVFLAVSYIAQRIVPYVCYLSVYR